MDVGTQLRQARESRDLTIAAVAARTRIHAHTLDALERNDLSAVPPRPYARGFVAAFAREVGLNPDQTVREYFAQFPDVPIALELPPVVGVSDETQWRSWMSAAGVLALVLTVGLLIARRSETPRASEPEAVGTSGRAASTAAGTVAVPKQAAAAGARHDLALPRPVPADPSVQVVLESDRPAWIAATVDGKRQLYQILAAGTKTTMRGTREIAIRVGDAGAVRWSINGREAVTMGASGAVRDVTITPQNMNAIQ